MNISYSRSHKHKKKQPPTQKLTDQEKELLQTQRKLNKEKKKMKKFKKKKELNMEKIKKKERKIKTNEEKRNQKIQQKLRDEQKEIQRFSDSILSWLSCEHFNKIAILTGYIKNVKTKIPPLPFILTLAYGMFGNGASTFMMLAANMATWFSISITPQALFGRISKKETVNFLKCILIEAMTQQLINGFKNQYETVFSCFTSVLLEDSTQFKLNEKVGEKFKGSGGSASKSAMKLNIVYNITQHTISDIDIVPGAITDQALSKNILQRIKKGMLLIRDLGYFNIFDMHIINKIGAYFLSRLKKGINIFFNAQDAIPIDIHTFLEKNTKNGSSFDQDIYIGESASRTKVRIIGEKVPEEVKQKRIENYKKNKIKRDKKKSMKEDYVVWFGYSIFITNVPRKLLGSATIIMAIYRIRWQIELFFLRMKSILQIDIIKGSTVNRVHCLIYAKLISLLMAQSIMSYVASIIDDEDELSEYKLMVWLQDNNRLGNAMVGNLPLEELFEELIASLYLLCKNKRKRKSTFRIIQEAINNNISESLNLKKVA